MPSIQLGTLEKSVSVNVTCRICRMPFPAVRAVYEAEPIVGPFVLMLDGIVCIDGCPIYCAAVVKMTPEVTYEPGRSALIWIFTSYACPAPRPLIATPENVPKALVLIDVPSDQSCVPVGATSTSIELSQFAGVP